jgi:hypothetical protein
MLDGYNPDVAEVSTESLKMVGKKLPNGTITWYSDTDLLFVGGGANA